MKPDSGPQYITDDKGNRVSVVLPVDNYLELLDDLEDLAAVAERRNEESISHDDVLKHLKRPAPSYEPESTKDITQ